MIEVVLFIILTFVSFVLLFFISFIILVYLNIFNKHGEKDLIRERFEYICHFLRIPIKSNYKKLIGELIPEGWGEDISSKRVKENEEKYEELSKNFLEK